LRVRPDGSSRRKLCGSKTESRATANPSCEILESRLRSAASRPSARLSVQISQEVARNAVLPDTYSTFSGCSIARPRALRIEGVDAARLPDAEVTALRRKRIGFVSRPSTLLPRMTR